MKKYALITLLIHAPDSLEGRLALAKQVADVHADTVMRHIQQLDCPSSQKQSLVDEIIHTARERDLERAG